MRKRYISDASGKEQKFWDNLWSKASIEDELWHVEFNCLKLIFDKYFPKKGKILEGGCGLGQFLIYYRKKGYDIEGVDWAVDTVKRIKEYDNTIPVRVGNVESLPYEDGYFKAYYSGGVVEHFEEGPIRALKEAYRVLDKDGILIVTVPCINFLRTIEDFYFFKIMRRKSRDVRNLDGMEIRYFCVKEHQSLDSPFEGFHFYQYEHKRKEIEPILIRCGFKVIFSRRIELMGGIREFLNNYKLLRPLSEKTRKKPAFPNEQGAFKEKKKQNFIRNLLVRIIVSQDHDLKPARPVLYLLERICPHSILFVCKK
jgi:SAM-dependent methyltransferase